MSASKKRAAGPEEISAEDRAIQMAALPGPESETAPAVEPAPAAQPAPATEPAVNPADPFANLDALRLSQSFVEMAGAKKLLTTVPVRKPNKQEYLRVLADPAYRMDCAIIELKEDREIYFVVPAIAAAMPNEVIPVTLFTAVNRQGVAFLWPVRMPTADRRTTAWYNSARAAAEIAMTKWVRVVANMSLGAYEIFEASGVIPDPEPIEHGFKDLLRIGFPADKFIGRLDHPVLKALRGE